jgi:serine/threonine protein kinase
VTEENIDKLRNQLVSALEYIQTNHIVHHPLRAERIIFTENIGNLKLIDVGFDQKSALSPDATGEDIYNYGCIIKEVLDRTGINDSTLRTVAEHCTHHDKRRRYRDIQELKLALANRHSNRLYIITIAFLALMVIILAWLSSPYRPQPIIDQQATEQSK